MKKSNKKSSSKESSFLKLRKIGTRFLENIVAGKGKKENGEDISEDQILAGTDGDDKVSGGSGDDEVGGGVGNDKVSGGSGDDRVWGGEGNDKVSGGSGDDRVWGGTGNDLLKGGSGDDLMRGGSGDDVLKGGTGDDVLHGDGHVESVTTLSIENVGKASAGYHNSYGYYLAGEDGEPTTGEIIWADVKDSVGQTFNLEGVEKDKIGFFLIPNGDNVNKGLSDGQKVTFEQDQNGNWSPVVDGQALRGQSGAILYSNTELNKGDYEYAGDSDAVGNQNWEDLLGGGDRDNNDVNMNVTWATEDRALSGDDILKGGAGNDELFGGAGDDVLDGESGNDRI